MPDWNPPWGDVPFNDAAAVAVTDAAAMLDRIVESSITSLVGLSHDARVDWTGPHLEEFERSYPVVMRDLYDVRDALFDLQRRVAAAQARAAAEQARRENMRAQWRAEKAAELTAMAGMR